MLHSKEGSAKQKKGFTLAELLIVVGIIVVLLALATGFVVSIQRSIRQRKLDDCARQIYLSAQQELAYIKYSGRMQEVEAAAHGEMDKDYVRNTLFSSSVELQQKVDEERIKLCFFVSDEHDLMKNLILPKDGIDPNLRDAHYVVIYDSINGNVYDVYYAEKEPFNSGTTGSVIAIGGDPVNASLSGVAYKDLRDNEDGSTNATIRQRRTHATIGYYGGSAIWEEIPEEMDVHLTIQNKEQLKLFVSYHEPDSDPVEKLEMTITDLDVPDVDPNTWTIYSKINSTKFESKNTANNKPAVDFGEVQSVAGRWMTEFVLDSMEPGKGFSDITKLDPNNLNDPADPGMITGDNIRITVKAITKNGVIGDASIETNSGFASKEVKSGLDPDEIKIAYGRHLQNLQNYDAPREFNVAQVRNIHFENIVPKNPWDPDDPDTDEPDAECWYALYYEDGKGNEPHIMFKPITNAKLQSFDGGEFMIKGLTIDTTVTDTIKSPHSFYETEDLTDGVGMFGIYSGKDLKNIRLVDTAIKLENGSSVQYVGAIAAQAGGTEDLNLNNCYVYLSQKFAKELANGSNKLMDVRNKGVVISGGTDYTGGLVGYVHDRTKLDVKDSFVATTMEGQKAADGTFVTGSYVGGLFGSVDIAGKMTLHKSYADNYLFGYNTAGLIGLLADGQELVLKSCYAAGFANAKRNTADFLLMNTVKNDNVTMENAYSVVSQLTDTTAGGQSFHISNGEWNKNINNWNATKNPTVFVPGAEAASQGVNLGFQFRADMTVSTFIDELNSGADADSKFKNAATGDVVTNPYNLMANGLTEYPFPVLMSGNDPTLRGDDSKPKEYRHFGDWRVTFNSGLVYYEKYYDPVSKAYSYEFTGVGGTIKEENENAQGGAAQGGSTTQSEQEQKRIVADGYAYALTKEDFEFAKGEIGSLQPHLTVAFTGSTAVPEGTAKYELSFDKEMTNKLTVEQKKVGESPKTYVLIPLDAYIENKLPEGGLPTVAPGFKGAEGEKLYYAISLNDNLYYFNPYFAQTVRTSLKTNAKDLFTFTVRTARQLNKLSENTGYWKLEQLNIKQDCDIDYRYYKGYEPDTNVANSDHYTGVDGGANIDNNLKTKNMAKNAGSAYKDLFTQSLFNLPVGHMAIQKPIGVYGNDFRANYDGGGYVITGVNFALETESGTSIAIGLFGSNNGKLSNITLNGNHVIHEADGDVVRNAEGVFGITKSNINGSGTNVYLGALVGINGSRGIIENCAVTGYRTGSNMSETGYYRTLPTYTNSFLHVGGLVGENDGNITKCSADIPEIEVTSTSAIVYGGAFAGYNANSGRITTCYAFGRIHGHLDTLLNAYYGGFSGYNAGIINSAYCASSVVVGGMADRYSFTCNNGGSLWDCYYVADSDGTYYGNVYAYMDTETIPPGVTKVEGFKDRQDEDGNIIYGLDSLLTRTSIAGFALAQETTVTTQQASGNQDDSVAQQTQGNNKKPEFPYPSVITRNGKPVSVGNWPTDAELGKVGIIYWECEKHGNKEEYHFSTLSANGVRNSTLCTEHDDGGYIIAFGYGYYYYFPEGTINRENDEWEITDACYVNLPVVDRNNPGVVPADTAKADEDVANALADAMPGYQFVVYQSGEGSLDEKLQMTARSEADNNFLKYHWFNDSEYMPNAYFTLNPKLKSTQDPGQNATSDPNQNNTQDPNQGNTSNSNMPTGEHEHTFVFNPFFADSMQVYKKNGDSDWENKQALVQAMQDLGTGKRTDDEDPYLNQYSVRSVEQLQLINWNSYSGDTKQQVQDPWPNHQYEWYGVYYYQEGWDREAERAKIQKINENFLYMRYTYIERTNVNGKDIGVRKYGSQEREERNKRTGYNFYWQQCHDVGRSETEEPYNFIPIGSMRDIGTPEVNDFSAYPYLVYFCGVYNGRQYEIRNIDIKDPDPDNEDRSQRKYTVSANDGRQAIGLFGVTMGAKLQNIIMYSESGKNVISSPKSAVNPYKLDQNRQVMGWYTVGGLVGFAAKGMNDDSEISNCGIAGYKIIDQRELQGGNGGGNLGGLIGATNMPITNCTAVTNIEINIAYTGGGGNLRVGGLAGCLRNRMENCYSGGKIDYGNRYREVTINENQKAAVWIGGLNGGIYMRGARMQDLVGPTGLVGEEAAAQRPTVKNCYSYMEYPDRTYRNSRGEVVDDPAYTRRAMAILSIASNGEYQDLDTVFPADNVTIFGDTYNFTTNVYIENSFALDMFLPENTTDYYIKNNRMRNVWGGWLSSVNLLKIAGEEHDNGGSNRAIYITNNTRPPYLSYQEMSKEMFGYLGAAGFARVSSEEDGVVVNGKYSFNPKTNLHGEKTNLDGKNYPFPTILKQDSGNATYNVHYGDWPGNGILVPAVGRINMLVDGREQVIDSVTGLPMADANGNPILGPAKSTFIAELTSDIAANGTFKIEIDDNAKKIIMAEVERVSGKDKTYAIKVTALKKGIATIKLVYTEPNSDFVYEAYLTVLVEADIKLEGVPDDLTAFAGTTLALSTLEEPDPITGIAEWKWKAYAPKTLSTDIGDLSNTTTPANPADDLVLLTDGIWCVDVNDADGLRLDTTGGTRVDPQTSVQQKQIGTDGKVDIGADVVEQNSHATVIVDYYYNYRYVLNGVETIEPVKGSKSIPVTIIKTEKLLVSNVNPGTERKIDLERDSDDGTSKVSLIPEGKYDYWDVEFVDAAEYQTDDKHYIVPEAEGRKTLIEKDGDKVVGLETGDNIGTGSVNVTLSVESTQGIDEETALIWIVGGTYQEPASGTASGTMPGTSAGTGTSSDPVLEKNPQIGILLMVTKQNISTYMMAPSAVTFNTMSLSNYYTDMVTGSAMPVMMNGGAMVLSLSPDDLDESSLGEYEQIGESINESDSAEADDRKNVGINHDITENDETNGKEDLEDFEWMPYQAFGSREEEIGTEPENQDNEQEEIAVAATSQNAAMAFAVNQMLEQLDDTNGKLIGNVVFDSENEFDATECVEAKLDSATGNIYVIGLDKGMDLPQTVNVVFYGANKNLGLEQSDEAESDEPADNESEDEKSLEEGLEDTADEASKEESEKADYMVIIQPITIVKSIDLGEKIVVYGDEEEELTEEALEEETEDGEKALVKKEAEPDQIFVKDGEELFDTGKYEWIPAVYEDPDYTILADDSLWNQDYTEEFIEWLSGTEEESEEETEEPETENKKGKEKDGEINEKITVTVANLLVTVFEPKKSSMTFYVLDRPEEKEKKEEEQEGLEEGEEITSEPAAEPTALPTASHGALSGEYAYANNVVVPTATPIVLGVKRSPLGTTEPGAGAVPTALPTEEPGGVPTDVSGEEADATAAATSEEETEATPTATSEEEAEATPTAASEEETEAMPTVSPNIIPTALPKIESEEKDPMVVAYLRFYGMRPGEDIPSVIISLKVITEEAKEKEPLATPKPTWKPGSLLVGSPSPSPTGSPYATASGSPAASPAESPEGSAAGDLAGSPLPTSSGDYSASPTAGEIPVPTVKPEPASPQETEEPPVPTEIPVPASTPELTETEEPTEAPVPTAIPGSASEPAVTEQPD